MLLAAEIAEMSPAPAVELFQRALALSKENRQFYPDLQSTLLINLALADLLDGNPDRAE